MSPLTRARALWRRIRRFNRTDEEMHEEMRFHLEMETARLVRRGLDATEARRQALVAFGGVEKFKEEGREARGFAWVSSMPVDLKLGVRMLVKYPALTVVGGIAIAMAVAVAAVYFELLHDAIRPALPLPDGRRIVAIHNWDAKGSAPERRSLHDFITWREQARTIERIGAYRTVRRNLIAPDRPVEPIELAEMSATAFQVTNVRPYLGRYLLESDEEPGALPVMVVGYDTWRARFRGDEAIIGRTVQLGSTPHTIVGVMPPGFAFPVRHDYWVPFRTTPSEYARRKGPTLDVFGRLANGVTLAQAQAEMTTLGERAAAAFPQSNAQLRPVVTRYGESLATRNGMFLYVANFVFVGLLVIACANVATLTFARVAARRNEITIRNALGAGRGRITRQLFTEALVFTSIAAAAGLAVARWALGYGRYLYETIGGRRVPFWWNDDLTPSTFVYAAALAVLAAAVIGVLPARKATEGVIQSRMQWLSAGAGGMRRGRMWTAALVIQVALSVGILPMTFGILEESMRHQRAVPGLAADQFLAARVEMDGAGQHADTYRTFERRLTTELGEGSATFCTQLPGMMHPRRRIELENGAFANDDVSFEGVSIASIDDKFFSVLGVPVVSGRAFDWRDIEYQHPVAIVNEAFGRHVLGGKNPIGQRIRYVAEGDAPPEPWVEIVGVVPNLGMFPPNPEIEWGVYHPIAINRASPLWLAVRVGADAPSAPPRLRAIAADVDARLQLHEVAPLSEVGRFSLVSQLAGGWIAIALASVALLLSGAAIWSLVSFEVATRRRELGIRRALGASRAQVLKPVLARMFTVLAGGVVTGVLLVSVLFMLADVDRREAIITLAGISAFMMSVGMLASAVPALRAFQIQPTEVLKEVL